MVQIKRNQEKVVVTKICFHDKTKWKMKVIATQIHPDGSDKKDIRKRLPPKYNISSGQMKWKM